MKKDEGDVRKSTQSTTKCLETKKKDEKKDLLLENPDISQSQKKYMVFQDDPLNQEMPTHKRQIDTHEKQLFEKLLSKIKLYPESSNNFELDNKLDKKEPQNPLIIELGHRNQDRLGLNHREKQKKEESHDEFGLGAKPWHTMSENEILSDLDSNIKGGLSAEDYERRLSEKGLNRISPVEEMHWIIKFILNMKGESQLFLLAGGIICLIVYCITNFNDYQILGLGIICFFAAILTSLFHTFQQEKSKDVMAELKALCPDEVTVLRGGEFGKVLAETLVPGDIILVKSGEKVPADIRVLSSIELKVNNASLTGENIDIKLESESQSESLYEAKNIARMGCNFTHGSGVCIVFSTADNTFLGHIVKNTNIVERSENYLTKEIKRLVLIMGGIAIIIGISFLILALVTGYKAVDAVMFMIAIIVANVPKVLLPQITLALTLTAKRLRKKDVIVTNLDVIGKLGAVTAIVSEKNGILSCNRMTVSHMVYDETIFITPITPNQEGDTFSLFDANNSSFKVLQKIAALNSEAVFTSFENDVLKRTVAGDASEAALIKFVVNINDIDDVVTYRMKFDKPCSIPLNPKNKWMCSVIKHRNSSTIQVLFKGAPERVLARCDRYLSKGELKTLNDNDRMRFEKLNETLAERGERVLGFAYLDLEYSKYENYNWETDPPNFPIDNLIFVGFFSLIDPPKEGVREAIMDCKTAGVRVIMVTGDHPITALTLARSLNLITGKTEQEFKEKGEEVPKDGCKSIVVTGNEMNNFDVNRWEEVLNHEEIVFARLLPQQKKEIVNRLEMKDHIVALTGDGLDDVPALSAAQVGIVIGSGAQVAKDAGQLILLQDDFKSIVEGIREGRLILDNLKKTICYILSSNIPELIPFLLFIALKIPLSIEAIMIILIDVVINFLPAISLTYEETEDSIMEIPPRKSDSHLVGKQLMITAYLIIGLFEAFGAYFSWAKVWYSYEFNISDLMGAGIGIRDPWKEMNDESKTFFKNMCKNSKYYQRVEIPKGKDCEQDFKDFLIDILAVSQSAFLMTVVLAQIANLFIRKTQFASLINWNRFVSNRVMFIALLSEIFILVLVIYVPGLNKALFLTHVDPVCALTGLWVMLFIILWDEIRKYLCRRDKNGWFAKYSVI